MRRIGILTLAAAVFMTVFGGIGVYAADTVTITVKNSPSYIMDTDDAGFSVSVNSDSDGIDYDISYTVDGTVYSDTVSTQRYRTVNKNIALTGVAKGVHSLNIAVSKDGTIVKSASAKVCLIDYYEKRFMDEYGRAYMSTHFIFDNQTDSTDLDIMKKTGIAGVRDEIYWNTVRYNGVWNFSKPDGFMPMLNSNGMDTCIILDYSNTYYVKTSVDGAAATERTAPRTAEEMQAFVDYVKGVITRYPMIKKLEIWNEPNWGFWEPAPNAIDYAAMVKAVSKAVKEIDPDIYIMAGSLVYGGYKDYSTYQDYLKELLDEGVYRYIDAISSHPYAHPQGVDRLIESRLDNVNDIINQYGGFKGHVATEAGATTADTAQGCTEEKQASELAKTFVYDDSRNIEYTYWYSMRDHGNDANDNEHRFGILNRDYTAKPAVAALSQYTNRLNGAVYFGRLNIGVEGNVNAFLYLADGDPVVVAWVKQNNENVTIPNTGVEDMYGNSKGTQYPVMLTTDPVYITAEGNDIFRQSAEYELGRIYDKMSDKLGLSRFGVGPAADSARNGFDTLLARSLSLIDEAYMNGTYSERKMMSLLDTLFDAAEKYALLSAVYGAEKDTASAAEYNAARTASEDSGKQYSEAVFKEAKKYISRMNEIESMADAKSKAAAAAYYSLLGGYLSKISEHISGYEQAADDMDVLLYTSKTNVELIDNEGDLKVTAVNGNSRAVGNATAVIKDARGNTVASAYIGNIGKNSSESADIHFRSDRPGMSRICIALSTASADRPKGRPIDHEKTDSRDRLPAADLQQRRV